MPLRVWIGEKRARYRRFREQHNPSLLSGQPDQTSYLYSVGNQAADRLSHAMHSLVTSKEFQKLSQRLEKLAAEKKAREASSASPPPDSNPTE
jgi:hypothetical protein